jgi:hypothetical protein
MIEESIMHADPMEEEMPEGDASPMGSDDEDEDEEDGEEAPA